MNENSQIEMIKVVELHKYFGKLHVLQGISTSIYKSEVVAIMGPSGGGKSTFLRCLNRLEDPTSGEIYVEGIDITDPHMNLSKVRQNIGMVFQSYNLFPHLTAIQNITLAPIKYKKNEPKRC